jgi:tetratricopeptide (TPR) repeat protein
MTTITLRPSQPHRGAARLLGAVLALTLIWLVSRVSLPAPAATAPQPGGVDAAATLDGAGALGLLPPDERVGFWEARVAAGGSFLDLIHLADAYLDRSRATGALDDLERAATALDQAATTAPHPEQVTVRRALVAFALHDFAGAMERADAVLAELPTDLAALGVSGDARLETGDVAGARQRYEQLAALAPSPAAWSRLGRVAFLTGDREASVRLVSRAASASADDGAPDAIAFYQFQLGELHRFAGELDAAEAAFRSSLTAMPAYVPAMAGLAGVLEAGGDRAAAIRLLERATARLPQPDLISALGDLYLLDGQASRAESQYRLVQGIGQLSAASGSVYDRQLVIFAADHERGVDEAVARAQAELAVRADIYGHDALAWALYRAGRLREASQHAAAAMALGTPDPRIAYHAGLIAVARGDAAAARPLLTLAVVGSAALPPLQAEAARDALAAIQADVRS